MQNEQGLITKQEAQDNSPLFNLAWSLHKKDGFLSKFKAGTKSCQPHSLTIFIFKLKYFLESNNKQLYRIPYRSSQHTTWRVQAPTVTQTATASSHTQHYDVIWMC